MTLGPGLNPAGPEGELVECINGHPNPQDWVRCGECGSRLDKVRLAKRKKLLLTGFASALAAVGIVITIATHNAASHTSAEGSQLGRGAIEAWWTSAGRDVHELQNALADTDEAIERGDSFGISEGCQRMHDAAAVNVPSHLPSPDRTLTAELAAADQDSHAAAHMCLAIFAHSRNGYSAEFQSTSDQAQKHVAAALALVEQALTS